MTEFENLLKKFLLENGWENADPIYLKEATQWKAKDLMEIARKQFIEEACNTYCIVCKMPNCHRSKCSYLNNYKRELEKGSNNNTLKAIKEEGK